MNVDLDQRIAEVLAGSAAGADALSLLRQAGLDHLPLPGEGQTIARWRALAAVAQFDLSLAKLYEGHTDALAILEEIDQDGMAVPGGAWCVWAAESPGGRTCIERVADGEVRLTGAKHWCSGALTGDHALLTAWEEGVQAPQLVAIDLRQPGIQIDDTAWKAVGMAASMSVNVTFKGATGRLVGRPGEYLSRPGFWHGGAGIAACWYGGATGIASSLKAALLGTRPGEASAFRLAALGRVELALEETAALLRQAAQWMDANPLLDASSVALSVRLSAEQCARRVIDEVGKALGAVPFCLDAKFAQAVADLPVFIRQSHADRDFAALGERALQREAQAWTL
ncbi:MAG: acyl-CoA dehydrogenase family protein [Polaromonas sp.]|nr:acyl-CoA dehydrogenase family protein [Polaromonas sp.]